MLPIYFAPIQGYTDDAYRRIHNELVGGITAYFSPFIRLEHGKIRTKDLRDIRPAFNEGVNLIPQIIASSAAEAEQLIKTVNKEYKYSHIDINMGCPFTLQTRHGRGCAILQNPHTVKDIADIISKYPHITFSVKMRLGLEDKNEWKSILPILNNTSLTHITLHPRTGAQQYRGNADLESFNEFCQLCQHPLIYNGDIHNIQDIQRIEHIFPQLSGIMIGRGLLSRPSLATEYMEGKEWDEKKRRKLIFDIHDKYLQHQSNIIPGEAQLLSKMQTFWYFIETELEKKAYKKIVKSGNMKNYLKAVNEAAR